MPEAIISMGYPWTALRHYILLFKTALLGCGQRQIISSHHLFQTANRNSVSDQCPFYRRLRILEISIHGKHALLT